MASGIVDTSFPVSSLVPKAETGVLNFLQKYPSFNGKDVTIAIFDSGVDPRGAGLEETVDGSIKVIEKFDCSGCGDTDVSKKVTASPEGYITGLSGRLLKVTSFMKQSNKDENEYRVGLKSLFDLYPSRIREKVSNTVKFKSWDEPHKVAIADISRQIQDFELQNTDLQSLGLKDKLKKEDLENSLDVLNNFEKKYMDIKTTYDCVVFRTDKCWYTIVDTTETGDLENGLLIGEFSVTHEVKNIDDYLSVSINVHDDGNVLELVGMCSTHGTHVASIASGNHSDKDLDGVAPNAKIVSLTIGDGRLGSMETGTALVRAIIKVMELCNSGTKIDVINMSYGEHAHWSNSGRIGDLMNEVVNKYGVVWVASAGNHGPALCTIGTPPDISQPSCIGVGAYVSPQMMEAEYALREKLPANVYTWTSRDPCVDGGQGVTVCAPGAAIASVPEYTMARAQFMNGTSMAAPHVAGAVALLISGLKQKGITYSPYSIKRALCNTATKLNYVDPFAQGSGLLNVEKAFEHLVQFANQQENLIRFSIKVGNQNAKGIHLRQGVLKKPVEYNVAIEPVFFNEKEASPKDKINFNVRLTLLSSQPWVQCGAFLDLCYALRTIVVKVDPVGLPPGVHTASIKVYDTNCIEKGSLFEIPITVIQPHIVDTEKSRIFAPKENLTFKPNTIQRDFILVPNNATWAVLRMTSVDDKDNQTGKFFVHTMQILPMKYCKALETMKILPVTNENETGHAFKCEENKILELCIAKYWSNFGDVQLKYSLEFHGIRASGANVMHAANGIHKLDVTTLGIEEISPSAQLKTATMVLRPSETKIYPLSAKRDVIPAGRQIYQNVLTYNLHIAKAQEVALCIPILCQVLYESEYESQFWMLFDSNKMMVACGDAYSNSNYVKVEKGEYVIRLQVRHEKKDILEKISEACMQATFKLQNPLTLDIYDHYNQSIIGGKKMSQCQLCNGGVKSLFIAPISNERLTKASIPLHCSILNGNISYAKEENRRKTDNKAFHYILTEGPLVKKNNGSPKNNKSKTDDYKEGLRDFNCAMISKLDVEMAEEVYKQVQVAYPKHLPAHIALIQSLDPAEGNPQLPFAFSKWLQKEENSKYEKLQANLQRIIELSNIVISETDKDALLAFYGFKNDTRSDAQKIKTVRNESSKINVLKISEEKWIKAIIRLRKDKISKDNIMITFVRNMDKQKNTLLEALVKKGISVCKLKLIEGEKDKELCSTTAGHLDEIDDIYTEIGKFVDYTDTKVIYFSIWHAHTYLHYGRMFKYLLKMYDDKLSKDILEETRYVAAEKKWSHVVDAIKKIAVSANPMGYRPF